MEYLDFASVMKILLSHMQPGPFSKQDRLIQTILSDVNDYPIKLEDASPNKDGSEKMTSADLSASNISRWLSRDLSLNSNISCYYRNNTGQRRLQDKIREYVVEKMPDYPQAARALCCLLMFAPNVSPEMKIQLTENFSCESEDYVAEFITLVLCFAMQRDFKKDMEQARSSSMAIQSFVNLSVVPVLLGHPDKGLSILQQSEEKIRIGFPDECSTYAEVQVQMGHVHLVMDHEDTAAEHYEKALALYKNVYAAQPEWYLDVVQRIKEMIVRYKMNKGQVQNKYLLELIEE